MFEFAWPWVFALAPLLPAIFAAGLASRHGAKLRKGKERALVDEVRVGPARVALAVPMTYMNDSGDAVRRLEAVGALRRLKPFHAIPAFVRALRDSDLGVREAAAETLIEIGDPKGTAAGLASADPRVRRALHPCDSRR